LIRIRLEALMKKAQKAAAKALSEEVAALLAEPLGTIGRQLDLGDAKVEAAWSTILTCLSTAVRVYAAVDPKVVADAARAVEIDHLMELASVPTLSFPAKGNG
jgi:hypothetical protein